ncbi:hypothetical protein BB050_00007 [Flavobacterium anhuiense]|uniref:Beta-glucosidase n=1 Tax=Flavobacterium anhuiense TaxID=459526 RepID=A0AAC9CY94_9FLAO|nr:hypothetical protein BB050_00007 [Flavobacterium anhuiense]
MVRISVLFLAFTFFSCGSNADKSKGNVQENTSGVTALTDEQLLDAVQKQTFKYFWDYAEPNSGLARERYHPDGVYPENDSNIVTTGGSGFGLMALVSGMSQGYITKDQGVERLNKIADFLGKADRFTEHGHIGLTENTGKVKPFGTKDNGGDLV